MGMSQVKTNDVSNTSEAVLRKLSWVKQSDFPPHRSLFVVPWIVCPASCEGLHFGGHGDLKSYTRATKYLTSSILNVKNFFLKKTINFQDNRIKMLIICFAYVSWSINSVIKTYHNSTVLHVNSLYFLYMTLCTRNTLLFTKYI